MLPWWGENSVRSKDTEDHKYTAGNSCASSLLVIIQKLADSNASLNDMVKNESSRISELSNENSDLRLQIQVISTKAFSHMPTLNDIKVTSTQGRLHAWWIILEGLRIRVNNASPNS